MMLVDELPGVTPRGTLRPAQSGVRGGSDFIVDVALARIEGDAFIDNRGTEFQGYGRNGASFRLNAPGGLPLQLEVSSENRIPFREGKSIEFGGAYWLPGADTLVTANVRRGAAEIGGRLREEPPGGFGLDFKTKSAFQNVTLEHFLRRTRRLSVALGARFGRYKIDVEESDQRIFKDRLTTVGARALVEARDLPWIGGDVAVDLQVEHGLDAFGASTEGIAGQVSRVDGEIDFTAFRAEVSGRWSFGLPGVFLDIRGQAQRATTHLLSSQEFTVGGERFGRAYEAGEIAGEHGVAFSTELSKRIRFEPVWAPDVTLFGFYEVGRVWDDDQTANGGDQSIASAGYGARITGRPFPDGPRIRLFGERAFPLTRQPTRIYADGLRSRTNLGADIVFSIADQ